MLELRLRILDIVSGSRIRYWNNFLKKSQWWTKQEIKNYQEDRFLKLVDHVFAHSPYYQEYFKTNGLERHDFVGLDDLNKFPIMRREDVAENLETLLATNRQEYKPMRRSTGGTTGTPLVYYSDKEAWSVGWALKLRDWSYGKYRIGSKMGLLAGGSLIPDQGFNLKRTIWNFITGFHPFPSAHYNKEVFEDVYQYMLKNKVKF